MNSLIALPSVNHEVGVMAAIEQAAAWLVEVQRRDDLDAAEAAMAHAQMATIAEATRRLGMDKENLINAEENVRRSEFVKARAIRRGQAEGTIATKGERLNRGLPDEKTSVSDYFPGGSTQVEILGIADEASPDEFDAALAEAKAEGNLSRANVARKIRNAPAAVIYFTQRVDEVREFADKGASLQQAAKHFGVTENTVSELCRANGILLAHDRVGKRRRLNYNTVLDNTIEAIEVAAMSLRDMNPTELDKDTAAERLDSLTASITALSKAAKKIKESFHDQDYSN